MTLHPFLCPDTPLKSQNTGMHKGTGTPVNAINWKQLRCPVTEDWLN
jgi:hypothetical protein